MATVYHKRATVASIFQIGISRNTKSAIKDSFANPITTFATFLIFCSFYAVSTLCLWCGHGRAEVIILKILCIRISLNLPQKFPHKYEICSLFVFPLSNCSIRVDQVNLTALIE